MELLVAQFEPTYGLPIWQCVLFLFVLGSVIGSFLNVVVYRLPAGLSLVRPGSFCPRCRTPIRPWDNIPILGWAKLRGRCRACGEPISGRYPLVELLTGLLLVALAVEPLSGGANLPASGPAAAQAGSGAGGPLWGMDFYHALLFCALLAAALIEYDGHALGHRLVWPVVAIGAIAPLLLPDLRSLPAYPAIAERIGRTHPGIGFADGFIGAWAGLVIGCLMSPLAGASPSGRKGKATCLWAMLWLGLYLGWQATVWIAIVATAVFAAMVIYRPAARSLARVPLVGCLLAVALAWLLAWHGLAQYDARFGYAADPMVLLFGGVTVTLLSLGAWQVVRRRPN
jgi:leader peptidase (prepilin peptidase) / N-methyltransferase